MIAQAKSGPRRSWLRTLWAGLLSLVLPGPGQVYAGAWGLGAVLYLVAVAFDAALIGATQVVLPTPVALTAAAAALVLFRNSRINIVKRYPTAAPTRSSKCWVAWGKTPPSSPYRPALSSPWATIAATAWTAGLMPWATCRLRTSSALCAPSTGRPNRAAFSRVSNEAAH